MERAYDSRAFQEISEQKLFKREAKLSLEARRGTEGPSWTLGLASGACASSYWGSARGRTERSTAGGGSLERVDDVREQAQAEQGRSRPV